MRQRARTIRLRLTLIYGGVFLVSSAALLTVGFLLVRHNLDHRHSFRSEVVGLGTALYHSLFGKPPGPPSPSVRAFQAGYHQAVGTALHRLLLEYAGALVVMTGVSVALGWWIAGRALAPLREITATAQRVSGENLGERIALQGPNDELKKLADTFDGMLMRLDSAFASQKHFVANASHEMRTPLAIMRTEIDVALADPHASVRDLRMMGEAVRDTVDRSESLIAALLLLARSEGVHGREEPVDIAELAGDCITDLHHSAEEVGVTVTTALESAVVRGDSALLERMLANLVENAIRHNHHGGRLSVSTATVDGMAEVLVRNSGAVIDPVDVQSLTEPFRRLSRTAGGFGLGLSIVRSVAVVHGGTVELKAPAEGGLEVCVRVPADPIGSGQSRRQRSLTKS
ncbi:MAG TPA: HAMP domain-containing sensor histidine kinase [Solirubrobacteraceae bacterium]|jgi:signal transduction histidine kinase|nr:HAMP domain-containing sensor histidine kinase [Solirubrobacteraceae bacterium]